MEPEAIQATAGRFASPLARRLAQDSAPRSKQVHLVEGEGDAQLLVVNGSRLYRLPEDVAESFRSAIAGGDSDRLDTLIDANGLHAAPFIGEEPPAPMPVTAMSLAVAQKCNLGCGYCYAQQGSFGGTAKNMSWDTASKAVDLLLAKADPSTPVSLAFLGGEPLINRDIVRKTTAYAAELAQRRGVGIRFAITTNGTLLTHDDADFFEGYGFAVTVSLDGPAAEHDRLRRFKNGRGSFDHIIQRLQPLLDRQRRMQVSARVTVTPHNLDLPEILDQFIGLGFHSVGFSPLLRSPKPGSELDAEGLGAMLQGMIACGLQFEQHVLRRQRYPFLNMINALRELQRGTHRPYPCGAGAGYFGLSADGELAACHRFVGDSQGQLGDLTRGVDVERQTAWLRQRHVHAQEPCNSCWARYLCGGGCHHEVLARGRTACDYIRGWLHYTIQAYGRLERLVPDWASGAV